MKKGQKNKQYVDEYSIQSSKNKKKGQGKIHSIEQVLDSNDSIQTDFLCLLPDNYPDQQSQEDNQSLILVATKLLSDLKELLIIPFNKFWATLKFNLTVQNTLEIFLEYSPRRHFQLSDDPNKFFQEIYRSIFWIYMRMVNFREEDQGGILFESFQCSKIIYDQWLIDVMKLSDFAQIYGGNNEGKYIMILQLKALVKRFIKTAFSVQPAYLDDYKSTVELMNQKILSQIYQNLVSHTNQSNSEGEIFKEDIQYKMESLVLTLDTLETILTWLNYFPNQEIVLNNVGMIGILEQIFYEILIARGFVRGQGDESKKIGQWKFDKLSNNQDKLFCMILQKVVDIFKIYIAYFTQICLEEKLTTQKLKFIIDATHYLLNGFGIVRRKQKKKQSSNESKEWHLLEALNDQGCSIYDVLSGIVPWQNLNQVDKNEKEEFLIYLKQAISEREQLKKSFEINEDDYQQEQQNLINEIDDFNPEESKLDELARNEQNQDKDNEQMEEEPEQSEPAQQFNYQEENLVPIIPKRQQKISLDLPQQEKQELADLMIKLYNDEPDDTYDFQDFGKQEKAQNSSTESDGEGQGQKRVYQKKGNYNYSGKNKYQQQYPDDDANYQDYQQSSYQQRNNYQNSQRNYNNNQGNPQKLQNYYEDNKNEIKSEIKKKNNAKVDQKSDEEIEPNRNKRNDYQKRNDQNNYQNKSRNDNYDGIKYIYISSDSDQKQEVYTQKKVLQNPNKNRDGGYVSTKQSNQPKKNDEDESNKQQQKISYYIPKGQYQDNQIGVEDDEYLQNSSNKNQPYRQQNKRGKHRNNYNEEKQPNYRNKNSYYNKYD